MQKDNDFGNDNENDEADESFETEESVEKPVNRISLNDIKKRADEKLQQYALDEGITPKIYKRYRNLNQQERAEAFSRTELDACRSIDRRYANDTAESMRIMKNFANPLAAEMAKISEAMGKNMIKGLNLPKINVPKPAIPKVTVPKVNFQTPITPSVYEAKKLDSSEKPQQTSHSYLAQITIPENSDEVHEDADLQREIIDKHNTQIELTQRMVELMASEAEASKVRADESKQLSVKMLKWAIAAALIASVGTITAIATGIIG